MNNKTTRYVFVDENGRYTGQGIVPSKMKPPKNGIKTELGKVGQILQEDGTFKDDPVYVENMELSESIGELKSIIIEKQLVGVDCTDEQDELKQLLGL